jgi:twitching motility protein PilJ
MRPPGSPAASPDEEPLRLRDALRRRGTSAPAPADAAGPGFRLPLIGHLPPARQLNYLVTTLAVSLALSAGFVALNVHYSATGALSTQMAGDALMHSQRIGKAAPNAVEGNAEAFRQLDESRRELAGDLALRAGGGDYRGRRLPAPGGELRGEVARVS